MVLIGLLQKHFFYNLKTQKFPSHVIIVRKEDLLNFKEIKCFYLKEVNLSAAKSIDLSNLETLRKLILCLSNNSCELIVLISFIDLYGLDQAEIKIEEFSSLEFLKLRFESFKQLELTKLIELKTVELNHITPINSEALLKLIENLPNIELLHLHGKLSYFNLDSFYNLKCLYLTGTIMDEFNFDLFDNLCNQLEYITISCSNFDDKCLEKLFYGRNFPYLTTLCIVHSSAVIRLEKKFFAGLGNLKKLKISHSKHVQIIDNDVFSNLIQLEELLLIDTCIRFIDKSLFSNLKNLKRLTICRNRLESIDENCFSNLRRLEYVDLSCNRLTITNAFVGLDNVKIYT